MQRLIDVIKTSAFRDSGECYGRTAHTITREVTQPTALLHVLARYVVGTTPLSIVGELIPVAFPIYSRERGALTAEHVGALLHSPPEARHKLGAEVSEDLIEALRRPDLNDLLQQAVEARRQALVADRQALLARDSAQEGAAQLRWLAGIDRLAPVPYDMLTATIYDPAVRVCSEPPSLSAECRPLI